ncbi:1,4-dihydroxy-2-naphthoate polyprenyltransferase [Aliifodinibius sp. S!AR15-10]|uniref:1,4-dihydroxy-2-naphthoate polyprenyltransferase n=1 Tax=Aliifodinibius sp. S!AR15-10 TaxID=2950437 RepID=UPI0028639979|nr:1,4-dihydroxy-2-naphthoate polyprenyltransferase [Aliifodinibius sp. S!AR15-10]MDR8391109.1 1,4-dihydroxy-2-naphthoate polyprenyltransferase [Aliifodinibius sp. S!AR15-10]
MNNNNIKTWIKAARPQTLTAAFVPVFVGIGLAVHDEVFEWMPSSVALLCALLIQIGTNFANDYFDYKKGADTDERIGFERATATGQVTARQMFIATIVTMGLAFLFGLYLVWHAGWVILLIGVLSLICGVLYTGGPFPLGYNGLGDVFVFIFFGIVAVMGTYYVNALEWSAASFWASLAVGALSTNILVVNNLRDIEQDRPAGKNTIGVLFGENALRIEYLLMLIISFSIPPHLFFRMNFSWVAFLPYLTIPAGVILLHQIWTETDKRKLNKALERTAQFMALFGILLSLGIIWG